MITYVKLGVTKNVFVGLCHGLGRVEHVPACYDDRYKRRYPHLCESSANASNNATVISDSIITEEKNEAGHHDTSLWT